MSIANLFVPNNYELYVNANSLNIGSSTTPLTYYEEYNGNAVFSGAQNATLLDGLHIQRIGDIVHLSVGSNEGIASATDTLRLQIPSQFVPTRPGPRSVVYVAATGTTSPLNRTLISSVAIVSNDGYLTFYNGLDVSNGNFIINNFSGNAYEVEITYHMA